MISASLSAYLVSACLGASYVLQRFLIRRRDKSNFQYSETKTTCPSIHHRCRGGGWRRSGSFFLPDLLVYGRIFNSFQFSYVCRSRRLTVSLFLFRLAGITFFKVLTKATSSVFLFSLHEKEKYQIFSIQSKTES